MYPSRVQYKTAVMNEMFPPEQNGGYSFKPVLDNSEPLISAGGNATVFKVIDPNADEYALKLFSDEIQGRFARLNTISKYLESTRVNFFTHFQFVQNLIYVEIPGQPDDKCFFPGVVMKWINGKLLDIKIRELTKNGKKSELRQLAENFKKISLSLLESGIAHGDLKLSNILVNDRLDLFLIDYDGMFLPELKGQGALEKGTPSYQHPKRTEIHFDETIDHFSIINIYLSLLALSEKPDLFEKYNDGDNIIFTKEDFEDPHNSELFRELEQDGVQIRLIYYIRKSLENDSISIENINDLIKGNFPRPQISITHSPKKLVLGQPVTITWETLNTDFLLLDGENQSLNGHFEIRAELNQNLSFSYGTSLDKLTKYYPIKAGAPPQFSKLDASNTDLKFDEPLVLSWKAEHSKRVLLCYDDKEIDVTGEKKYTISKLEKDTIIRFILESDVGDFKAKEEILVKVFFPISLKVRQERNLTFTNRPVKIFIQAENAEVVTLKPGNIDLTGIEQYELRAVDNLSYQIIASNKRYISTFESNIDVLKPPSYNRKIVELPKIRMNFPELSLKLPAINKRNQAISQFDIRGLKINKFLDKFNIFKIDFNKKKS